MRISRTLLALLAVGALLGACGGDDDSADTESVEATTTTAAGGNASATTTEAGGGGTVRTSVTISKSKFSPAEVAVTKGGAVLWNFADAVEHTVTADDDSFDSGKKSSGTFQHTFDKAGTFKYHCEIHSFMKGSVTVS